jgi:hypothetical protein
VIRSLVAVLLAALSAATECSAAGLRHVPERDLALRMFYPAFSRQEESSFDPVPILPASPDTAPHDTAVNKARLALVGGALVGSMVVIHIYQQNGWWKDNRAPFHFQEDLTYGLGVDKIGHFYGAYLLQFVISGCVRWANVEDVPAMWIGSAGALLFQTYVEVEDGFSAWGFDRVDWASDLAGSAWPIARYYVPYLQNFDLKLSYHSSSLLGSKGGIGFRGQKHLIIDDYEGQTLWMALNVHNMLPESWRGYWPRFLNLAVGYGAREVAGPSPYPVVLLAPDLDMTAVIPPSNPLFKTIGEVLNFIHMPLPAVQVSPTTIWYGVYF